MEKLEMSYIQKWSGEREISRRSLLERCEMQITITSYQSLEDNKELQISKANNKEQTKSYHLYDTVQHFP
jgi:hypothetical protein